MKISKTCQFCGKEFEGNTIYCSTACQSDAGSSDAGEIKVCRNCGKTYTNRSSEYCSVNCFNESL